MKIFRISQEQNREYDTYDSVVVYAEDEEKARAIHPMDQYDLDHADAEEWINPWTEDHTGWCSSPDLVKVEYLGEAKEGAEEGVVLGSFNAG